MTSHKGEPAACSHKTRSFCLSLGGVQLLQSALCLESDVFAALDDGVFLEIVVVAIREVRAVMAAAGLFAGQGGARDKRRQRMQVEQFVVSAGQRTLFCGDGGCCACGAFMVRRAGGMCGG